jgi:TolB-like protein
MFTDMVGYTALAQKDEPVAMELLEEHRRLLRPLFDKNSGREIKTIGDSFLVEFESALEAVRCAIDIQSALTEENLRRPNEKTFNVRIGVHLGDVIHDGADVKGDAVNVASRIEPLAPPGGICVSAQVCASVRNKIEQAFVSLGFPELKNVDESIEVFQIDGFGERRSGLPQKVLLPKNRIAVLPFANMSPDPADEYFADGMTEELIARLSLVEGLEVIARTSIMNYKKEKKNASQIGNELKVGSIVEGSVRKAANKFRITVQLIDPISESHRWSSTYDREFNDIFGVQSEISERVAEALSVKLVAREKQRLERDPTKNMEAYTLYLRGLYAATRGWGPDDIRKAIGYFERAVEQDPRFAAAYSWLSDCLVGLGEWGALRPAEAIPKAEQAARRALEIDPELAEAHLAAAELSQLKLDWTTAEKEIRKALELNPRVAGGHTSYAWKLASMGRFEESLSEARKALELDPLSPDAYGAMMMVYYSIGEYDKALEQTKRMDEVGADPGLVANRMGWCYMGKRDFDRAIAELQKDPEEPWVLAVAYAGAGLLDKAEAILNDYEERSKKQSVNALPRVVILLALGRKEEAIRLLQRHHNEWGYDDSFRLLKILHVFDGIRGDPRITELLGKIGLGA